MTGIYTITNKNSGRRYVGSAINIAGRFVVHLNAFRKGCNSRRLQRAWNKYGEGAFEFKPLLYCDKSNLLFYEQRAIDALNGNGYNLNPTAGSSLGMKHTEESRKKMSKANKGRFPSEETKRKLSRANKGRLGTFKGRTHTEETKRKISEAAKGRPNPFKGRTHTKESRRKMSKAAKGRICSDETTRKLTEKMKQKVSAVCEEVT